MRLSSAILATFIAFTLAGCFRRAEGRTRRTRNPRRDRRKRRPGRAWRARTGRVVRRNRSCWPDRSSGSDRRCRRGGAGRPAGCARPGWCGGAEQRAAASRRELRGRLQQLVRRGRSRRFRDVCEFSRDRTAHHHRTGRRIASRLFDRHRKPGRDLHAALGQDYLASFIAPAYGAADSRRAWICGSSSMR